MNLFQTYRTIDLVLSGDNFFQQPFFCLAGNLAMNANSTARTVRVPGLGDVSIESSDRERRLYDTVCLILSELQLLYAVCDKIELFFRLKLDHQLDDQSWFFYQQTEIHAFHIELRSLYDSIAKMVDIISVRPGQIPLSFNSLYTDSVKPELRNRLGPNITSVIRACDWFPHLRDVRDTVAHYSRDVQVGHLLKFDEIIFQLHLARGKHKIITTHEPFMWRNWVLLRPYAGCHLALVQWLLNELSVIAVEELSLRCMKIINFKLKKPETAINWINEGHSKLRASVSRKHAYEVGWERIFGHKNDT